MEHNDKDKTIPKNNSLDNNISLPNITPPHNFLQHHERVRCIQWEIRIFAGVYRF